MKRLLAVSALVAIGQIAVVHDCRCTPCDGRPPSPLREADAPC